MSQAHMFSGVDVRLRLGRGAPEPLEPVSEGLPGPNVIKLFMDVMYENTCNKLECLSLASISSID